MKKIPNIEAFLKMRALSEQAGCDEALFVPIRDKLQITADFIDSYTAAMDNGTRVPLILHSFGKEQHHAFLKNCRDNGVKTFLYASSDGNTTLDLSELARYGATLRGMVMVEIGDGITISQKPAIRLRVN